MFLLGIGLSNPFASVNHISAGNRVGEIPNSVFYQSWDSKPILVMTPTEDLLLFIEYFFFFLN